MIQQFKSIEFIKFLFCGGTGALVNFSSRLGYSLWFNFSTAILLAYATGMITTFILAKIFVFKKSLLPLHHSLLRFLLVNTLGALQTLIISITLADYVLPLLHITLFIKEIAHTIGIVIPVFSNYTFHKLWSFPSTQPIDLKELEKI